MIEIYIYKADVNNKMDFGTSGIGDFVSKAKIPNHITINQIHEELVIFEPLLELDYKNNFIIGVVLNGIFGGFYCTYEPDLLVVKNMINNIIEKLNE